ncbi:MAG: transposase, partial [Bacteroidales bacterium]
NFHKVIRKCFRRAEIVIDRFHVQQLANEALQDIRVKYRWEAIDKENNDKKKGLKSREIFSNGESRKQLLVRGKWDQVKKLWEQSKKINFVR